MKYSRIVIHIIFAVLFFPILAFTQISDNIENSDKAKILADWKIVGYKQTTVTPTLRLPQRKFDSQFFCDELMRYKEGYIINSITSMRLRGKADFTTNFYYFNEKDKSISHIVLPDVDTIESILTDSINTLYCSYKKLNTRFIASIANGAETDLLAYATKELKTQIDTAKWIKLGFFDNNLYALSESKLFVFDGSKWSQLSTYSIDSLYLKVLKYKRPYSFLPTRNIIVTDDHVFYLQEIVQDRSCRLFKLNIKTGDLSEFFVSQDYVDNTMKVINDFTILPDQSIVVCMSRLWKIEMLLRVKEKNTSVIIFENQLNNQSSQQSIEATAVLANNDTLFIAGTNGLFKMINKIISPLILWENGHQEIKEGKDLYDFEFYPRSIIKLSETTFLIGGMWGGLYLFDINSKSVNCLDDIPYRKIKNVDIRKL